LPDDDLLEDDSPEDEDVEDEDEAVLPVEAGFDSDFDSDLVAEEAGALAEAAARESVR
jgi:hypothetical protein